MSCTTLRQSPGKTGTAQFSAAERRPNNREEPHPMTEPTPVTVSPALLRGLVSRRTLLQGVGGVALTAGLAACGTAGTSKTVSAKDQSAKDLSATQKVVNWSNWPVYIDVDD